jgi:hypothetical protein
MKNHVAGQHRVKAGLQFGGILAAVVILYMALNNLPAVVVEEPFYLIIGLIAAFALGLVVFFTTRDDRLMH